MTPYFLPEEGMPLHAFLTLRLNPSLVRHANISRASPTHRQDASLENNRSSVMCFPIAASCTGPVPDVFGALSRLEMLALSSNRLTGEGCAQRSTTYASLEGVSPCVPEGYPSTRWQCCMYVESRSFFVLGLYARFINWSLPVRCRPSSAGAREPRRTGLLRR